MKRILTIVIFFIFLFQTSFAITYVEVNGQNQIEISKVPSSITLQCDVSATGNKVAVEMYVDINNNQKIDTADKVTFYMNFVDGLGWIRDPESPDNDIPGDETLADGIIKCSIDFNEEFRAFGNQTWLVRIIDQDESCREAVIKWNLVPGNFLLFGQVRASESSEPCAHVAIRATSLDMWNEERVALSDDNGHYFIELFPGEWKISAITKDESCYYIAEQTINFEGDQQKLNFNVTKYSSFIKGRVTYEDQTPQQGIVVTLQNIDNLELRTIETNEFGFFEIGVEPGLYHLSVDSYYQKYFGHSTWPKGYFACPCSDSLLITSNQICEKNIELRQYPLSIEGYCYVDGKPLEGALIQGIAIDQTSKQKQVFQTFSNSEGRYSLGIFPTRISLLYAQHTSVAAEAGSDYYNIDLTKSTKSENYSFSFTSLPNFMTLSGKVYSDQNEPLENVFVVAYNKWDGGKNCHLITQTDQKGYYHFDINAEGSWQIGIYKKDNLIVPTMYYKHLTKGISYSSLNFYLTDKKSPDLRMEGELVLTSFNIVPHLPDPIYKETVIDFILPKASFTQVKVLSLDGKELKILLSDELSRGFKNVSWDGTDDKGNIFDNGVYLCRIIANQKSTDQKFAFLR